MSHRFTYALRLLFILVLALLLPRATATRAASAGEELANASGTLSASSTIGDTFTTTIYSPGPANIRLEVSGGTTADKITLTVQGASTPQTWDVRSGETSWTYATIPSGGKLTLQNKSAKALTYKLNAFARGVAPTIADDTAAWSGTASGAGIESAIQLDIPTAGLYRFTLAATSGSFQLVVDGDANYLRKTVKAGSAPSANDSVYYLSTGTHTFTVKQEQVPAQLTTWSMELALVGGNDAVPYTENSAVLGGGSFFTEEWIPLQVAAAQPVNVRIDVAGAATNSLIVELYDGTGKVFTSAPIFGGEVAWGTSALTAGANRLHIVAGNNSAALAYTVTVNAVAQTPLSWSGKTLGKNTGGSTIKLNFPTSGLYRFNLTAAPGRYKLQLNGTYLHKIVTDAAPTNFTAFVAAGSYPLVVTQDTSVANTDWTVEVTAASGAADALPFSRTGNTLVGTSATFKDEWIPLQIPTGQPVNVTVTVSGAANDAVKLELYGDPTKSAVYSATTVYGGEIFWANTALTTGTNLLHIVAAAENTGPVGYQVDVRSVATIPSTWQGIAHGNGLKSSVQVFAPIEGVYNVVLTISSGTGQVLIDAGTPVTNGVQTRGNTITLRVPLTKGAHTVTFEQDAAAPATTWEIATSLRRTAQLFAYLPFASKVR